MVEPDPNANPSSNPQTWYYLNGAGQTLQVSILRAGLTQNRTFQYSGPDLISSTNPENGTVSYQYDGNHHVTLRTDANGQQTRYTYDTYERLNEVQYFTPGQYPNQYFEVTGDRVTYQWDSNPFDPYDPNTWGHLGEVTFGGGSYSYYYTYNQGGRVTSNLFLVGNGGPALFGLAAAYNWDNQGRMTSMTYPSGPVMNYTYDPMGRLSQISSPNYFYNYNQNYPATISASYNAQSQLSTLNYGYGGDAYTETRTYNNLMQLTGLTNNVGVNMQYIYTAGQNNGRVAQTIDNVLGETVNYGYDMWNRLTSASATNGNWGEQYTFDNFGNLTGKTPTAGSAPALSASYNLSTNQQAGASYDANGNPTPSNSFGGPTYTWNVENRLSQSTAITGIYQPTCYAYDPWGRRVWTEVPGVSGGPNTGEIYFYGATGQKLETYTYSWGSGGFASSLAGINIYFIYFGGKLLQSKGVWVATDKVGSVRANSNGESMSYWPYGEERTNTANDREKFGTYMRDGVGQDYAQQRYYNSNVGAFWTPDPGGISTANASDPASWNRYMYVTGDPANHTDSRGMEQQDPCGPDWMTNGAESGPCCDPSENSLLGAAPDPGCYAGGGGGGEVGADGSSQTPCPVTNIEGYSYNCIHRSGSDWSQVKRTLKQMAKAIKSDSTCFTFLSAKVGGTALNKYLKNVTNYYELADSITNPIGVADAGTYGTPVNGIPIVISDAVLGTPQEMEALLHEFAHLVGAIQPDGINPGQGATNDAALTTACGPVLGAK